MAIKERLLKQLNIVWDGLNAMPPFHSRDLKAMRNALVQARDLCFQGLSEKHFAEYKDTYDGLLFAIDQLAVNASDQEEIVSLCRELLQYTLVQTQKETQFKKEIFFLPYKASMWDSLESVWKAADEDKDHCIAYVMPIPYADLTPEHTVAEWHCEREFFPKDVPTLDWQTIDLEEMHPDVIFIHNPYDQYNRVTSVESRYYSDKLKACTGMLVYIPYFVLDDMELVETTIVHFVTTPAVLNADRVIVQSEKVRQAYINLLIHHTNVKDRRYWEKIITGEGSPKTDKVLYSRKEDFELPQKWLKIVYGKKVVLYNTSLAAMLRNVGMVCNKLRQVFEIFRKRDDIAFWWRPHPLMKATIESMCPQIQAEYDEIERNFRDAGWGIYDDTAELHRAIVYSDAYYGDLSSVIQLYKKTGKPIMLESMSGQITMADWTLATINAFIEGELLYFTPNRYDGVYILNTKTHDVEKALMATNWNNEKVSTRFGGVVSTKDKIILYPYDSNYFVEYDKNNHYLERHVKYDEILPNYEGLHHRLFYGGRTGEKVFVCGSDTFCVLVFDILHDTYKLLGEVDDLPVATPSKDVETHFDGYETIKKVFLLNRYTDMVYVIDKETEGITPIDLCDTGFKYQLIASEKNILWLLDENNVLVKYNIIYKEILETWQLPDVTCGETLFYLKICLSERKVCIVGVVDQMYTFYIAFDKKQSKFVGIKRFPAAELSQVIARKSENTYWVSGLTSDGEYIGVYDFETEKFEPFWLTLSDEQQKQIIAHYSGEDNAEIDYHHINSTAIKEGTIELHNFIKFIEEKKENKRTTERTVTMGAMIYKNILKCVCA